MKNGSQRSLRAQWPRWMSFGITLCGLSSLLIAGSSTAAMGKATAHTAAATIKFGYINGLTGPYAAAGVPELDGIKLAVADINAAGGVCKGEKIQLAATVDDEGQPNLSVAGIRKLAQQDGLTAVIGPTITAPGQADAPVANSLHLFQLQLTSQEPTYQGREYIWSAVSPQNVYGPLMINYMKKKLGPGRHKVAIYYADVPYGQFGDNELSAELKKMGWTVTLTENFDPSQFDFSSQAAKIAAAKPAGVFLWGAGTPADAQVLKQLRAAGYKGPAVGELAYSLPDIPADAGAAAQTVVAFGQLNTFTPNAKTKKFLTGFKAMYKQTGTYLSGAGYDAVYVLAAAAKRAGCTANPTALAKAMNGLTYQGVTGAFHYTANYKSGPGVKSFFAITYGSRGQVLLAKP